MPFRSRSLLLLGLKLLVALLAAAFLLRARRAEAAPASCAGGAPASVADPAVLAEPAP